MRPNGRPADGRPPLPRGGPMAHPILRRKPIPTGEAEPDAGGGVLTRSLGLWQLTAIGIGGIIGAGIFSLAGAVANETAGPAVLVSFLVAGVASAAAALAYEEFAGMVPMAGSAYTYGYVVLCLFIAFLLTQGIKAAARFETAVVAIKVALVLLVVIVGVFHVSSSNYTPFFPFGLGGAFTGAATVFFAVFGYDAMSTAAEESVDAKRHLPKAIIYSLAISMVLYVLACLVLVGMQNYTEIDQEAGFSEAFASVGLSGLADVIAVGAIVGILTVMFTFMLGVTRVWYAMSRDGLLPRWFSVTHPTRRVPNRITWIVGGASAIIAGLLPIGEAAELTNIGILLAFAVVSVAVIVLRYREPDRPRTFRTPGMPIVPLIGVGFSIWLITFLDPVTWLRFAVWFVLGLIIYFSYGYRRSLLARSTVG